MELGAGEIIVVLVIVLLLFGPSRLPQLGESLGRGIRSFKKALHHDEEAAVRHAEPRGASTSALPEASPRTQPPVESSAGAGSPPLVRK
jgi:sec-independent protein translocase protein TatA